jgi:type II secretory pathway pseudopilin PulG
MIRNLVLVVAITIIGMLCALAGPGSAASAQTSQPANAGQYQANFASVISTDTASSTLLPNYQGNGPAELYFTGDITEVDQNSTVGYYGNPHNGFVLEDPVGSADFQVLNGPYGTDYDNGAPTPGYTFQQVPNYPNGNQFWFSGGFVDQQSNTLYVYGEDVQDETTVVGDAFAQFNATTLAYEGITTWTSAPGFMGWSSSVAEPGGWWLFGMDSSSCVDATDCNGHVAWVPQGDELDPSDWTITDGIFSASDGLGNQLDVVAAPGEGFLAYAKNCDACGNGSPIKELSAPAATGPWTLTGRSWATSAPAAARTYSVQAHPDDSAPGTLLISYAVNGGGQYDPNFFATTALPVVVPGRSSASASAFGSRRSGSKSRHRSEHGAGQVPREDHQTQRRDGL